MQGRFWVLLADHLMSGNALIWTTLGEADGHPFAGFERYEDARDWAVDQLDENDCWMVVMGVAGRFPVPEGDE